MVHLIVMSTPFHRIFFNQELAILVLKSCHLHVFLVSLLHATDLVTKSHFQFLQKMFDLQFIQIRCVEQRNKLSVQENTPWGLICPPLSSILASAGQQQGRETGSHLLGVGSSDSRWCVSDSHHFLAVHYSFFTLDLV